MNSLNRQQQAQQSLDYFFEGLVRESSINPIVGSIGCGKTALLFRLAERLHEADSRRPIVVFKGTKRVRECLPKWFCYVDSFEEIDAGSHILIDESTQHLNARNSKDQANIEFSKSLAIIRHNDCSAYITTQLLSLLDLNALRLGILNFWMKRISSFSLSFERVELQSKLSACVSMLARVSEMNHIGQKQIGCVFNDDYLSFFQSGLPSFWSDQVSKSWGAVCP